MLAAGAGAALAGCADATPPATPVVSAHADGAGILSVRSDTGGAWSVSPPESLPATWKATFGTFMLCTDGGESAVLESVTWDEVVAPAAAEPLVRLVPPASQRESAGGYEPAIVRGAPSPGNTELRGTFFDDLRGIEIDDPCEPPPAPTDGRQDLALVVTADRAGAHLRDLRVAYTSGGRAYVLEVDYELVMCGTAIDDPGCPN